MKHYLLLQAIILFAAASFAQVPYRAAVPKSYTKKAITGEQVWVKALRYLIPESLLQKKWILYK